MTQLFSAAIVGSEVDPELNRTNTDITPSGLWLTHDGEKSEQLRSHITIHSNNMKIKVQPVVFEKSCKLPFCFKVHFSSSSMFRVIILMGAKKMNS